MRRSKGEHSHNAADDDTPPKQEEPGANRVVPSLDQQQVDQQLEAGLDMAIPGIPGERKPDAQFSQPAPVPSTAINTIGGASQQCTCNLRTSSKVSLLTLVAVSGYNDWNVGGQNQFHDMHNFHPSYMFNAPEVTNEYNLLNDFLSTSLLDDGAMFSSDDTQGLYTDPTGISTGATSTSGSNGLYAASTQQPQPLAIAQNSTMPASVIPRPSSVMPIDKARETYYMTAADPSGSDAPETRIGKLLQAKYDAGMLRPFNYVNGYARLNLYMDKNMQPGSRQKIMKQLEKFRPKFREAMHNLSDIQLVLVEMWFEKCLMEYDRVFASMAIPACCWRRTGEIFRGNREMAELIHVPIEKLRDVSWHQGPHSFDADRDFY